MSNISWNFQGKPKIAFRPIVKSLQVFSPKYSVDVGHTKLMTMKIYTGDHPHIAGKLYPLALKYYKWVLEEINALEKVSITEKGSPLGHVQF